MAVARAIEERRRRKLQVGLAASLLALTTLGGLAFTYELNQRQAAAARVDRLLAEARLLRDQAPRPARGRRPLGSRPRGRWAGSARSSVRPPRRRWRSCAARSRRGSRPPEADRALVDRLVDIRSAQADDPDGSATDAAYADAFAAAGIDPDRGDPAGAGGRVARRPAPVAAALVAAPGRLVGRPPRPRREGPTLGAGRWPPPAPPTPTPTATPSAPPCSWRTGRSGCGGSGRWPSGPTPGRGRRTAWSCSAGPWPRRATRRRAWRCCGGPRGPTRRTPGSTTPWAACWSGRGRRSRRRRSAPTRSPGAGSRSWPGTSWPTLLEGRGRGAEAEAVWRDLVGRRPENGRHLGCYGRHLKERGRGAEAKAVLARAVAAPARRSDSSPTTPRPTPTSASP